MSRSERLRLQAFKNVMERRSENNLGNMDKKEYLNIIVSQYHPELDFKENEYIKNERTKDFENVKDFFSNELKGSECDECKEESKGTMIFGVNTGNNGVSLSCKDFCCYNYEVKAKERLT